MTVSEHRFDVPRSARYYLSGDPPSGPSDLWIILHGYGQLARDLLVACHPLEGPGRLLAAPEALSRFYVDAAGRAGHADTPVGASWMTREDRAGEIDDYVRYLDAVHDRILATLPSPPARVHLLGFSQGVATAARWMALGRVAPVRLVLWGGVAPRELGAGAPDRLRGLRVQYVHGEHDELVPPAIVEASAAGLRAAGADVEILTFAGGHRLDSATLHELAGDPPEAAPPV